MGKHIEVTNREVLDEVYLNALTEALMLFGTSLGSSKLIYQHVKKQIKQGDNDEL